MAIDARVSFINKAEKRLMPELSAEQLGKVLSALTDILDDFDLRELQAEEAEDDDMLNGFISAMQVEGKSEKTIAHYQYIIGRMLNTINVPTRRVTVYHLRNYLASEKQRGLSDQTLATARQIFSSYFGWLQREGLIDKNPVANISPIKTPKKQKQIYSDIDIEVLYQHCKCKRDLALVAFLASTGCRISEAMGLNRDEVNLGSLECVVHGKGNKERTVYLDAVSGLRLQQYLDSRKDDDPALFHGQRGRLTPYGARRMLTVLSTLAGVPNVHPHKFRRTLATNLARKGMPIQTVVAVLGHAKLETTMKYVMLNNSDVKEAYRRAI